MRKKTAHLCTLNVKVNKHQIIQVVKKLCTIDVVTINALTRPGGEKKASVGLAPDYGDPRVANKIGIISAEFN